jgi:hypothetical protein
MIVFLEKGKSLFIDGLQITLEIHTENRIALDVERIDSSYRKQLLSHDEMDDLLRRDGQIPTDREVDAFKEAGFFPCERPSSAEAIASRHGIEMAGVLMNKTMNALNQRSMK